MKIAISAESAIDLPKDLLKKYNIHTTPFTVLLGDEMVLDGEISIQDIFEYVNKTKILPKTSAVNEHQFYEHFSTLLNDYDEVIHFSMSGSMSCAYNNAVSASKKFNNNVFVIDSKNLSTGIALLAIKARLMIDEGKDIKNVIQEITKQIPNVQTSLVIDKLDYLRKGGRCSGLVCFGANLLKLHPQIVLKNGKLSPAKKYRGNFDHCVELYVNDTLKEFNNYDKSIAFLTYTTASQKSKEFAINSLKNAGFKEVLEVTAGATISSHCGPNALGIIYLTK